MGSGLRTLLALVSGKQSGPVCVPAYSHLAREQQHFRLFYSQRHCYSTELSRPLRASKMSPSPVEVSATVLPKLNFKLGPVDIENETAAAIAECHAEFDKIAAIPAADRSFDSVMRPWAQAEGRFMTRVSSLTFPQYVSTDEAIRNASVNASKLIDNFHIERGMRVDLYAAVKTVAGQMEANKALNGEETRFLEKVMLEFKHNGLELASEEDRAELKELRKRLAQACTDFSQNMNEDATRLTLTAKELDGATPDFLESLERDEQNNYVLTMKYPDLFGVLQHVKSEAVRRRMDETNGRKCEANRELLSEAVRLRGKAARLLGYSEHAAFALENKMAKDPERVRVFLSSLREKLTPFAKGELERLRQLKAADLGRPASDETVELRSWDYHFYTRMLLEREYEVDEEKVKEYFSLTQVTAEMLRIFETVLGLRFEQVPNAFERSLVWHEDVTLWSVWNSDADSFVGSFYLDLFPRPGKYTHAACFDLQPGYTLAGAERERQYPVAAMVANFTKPTSTKPSLLKHDEVVTLFHELGHAMHDMCAHVEVPRFHGTSVEGDFVEAPSQMLENWCWQQDALQQLSAHYQTGEHLPSELVGRLIRTKNVNAGILNLRQIFFGTWDLAIHSGQQAKSASEIDELYERLRSEIALIPQPSAVWPAASFGHMMGGYDAGYYGYLWSQVFSADMFYSRFLSALKEPAVVGRAYRREILQPGGSRDGMESLKAFLGREPIQEPFLKSLGLV